MYMATVRYQKLLSNIKVAYRISYNRKTRQEADNVCVLLWNINKVDILSLPPDTLQPAHISMQSVKDSEGPLRPTNL